MYWVLLGISLAILLAALAAYVSLVDLPIRFLDQVGDTHKLCILGLARFISGMALRPAAG